MISPESPTPAAFPTLKVDTFKIIAYLDQEKPLSEPKWVKAGKAEEFLSDTFGPAANGHAKDWRGNKFEVLDPEEVGFNFTLLFLFFRHGNPFFSFL